MTPTHATLHASIVGIEHDGLIEAAHAILTYVVTNSEWRYQIVPTDEGEEGTFDFNMIHPEQGRSNLWTGVDGAPELMAKILLEERNELEERLAKLAKEAA